MLRINPVDKSVGEILLKQRLFVGETLETLAAKLDVFPEQIEQWEGGYARMPVNVVLRIAQVLGVRPSFFFSSIHETEANAPDITEFSPRAELMQMVRVVLALKNISSAGVRENLVNLAECLGDVSVAPGASELAPEIEARLKPV